MVRTDTPYIDNEQSCDGCGINAPVVMVGTVLTIGEDAVDDRQMIHPESDSCCLCKSCVLKALARFEPQ